MYAGHTVETASTEEIFATRDTRIPLPDEVDSTPDKSSEKLHPDPSSA